MTSGLRKAHKIIWLLIALIVPIIIVFAVKDLDIFSSKDAGFNYDTSKERTVKSAENEVLKINLKLSQLEVILKKPLKLSSAVLYDQNNVVIGQVSSVGVYSFNKTSVTTITLKDGLKNNVITQLTLN